MRNLQKCCVPVFLVVTIASVALRLPQLGQRPMHGDEAIHAVKFGDLLEEGYYHYNLNEYHGPTLNYLTLIPAWLISADKLTEVSEFTLRIVPVFFGVLLVLLVLLLADGLGRPAVVCAALLTAVSPAMVFYSRYYIQEMLLVCFTFGVITCGYRYTKSKNIRWALLTGIFLGLCHATKETCIIAFGSMLLALLLTLLIHSRQAGFISNTIKTIKPSHILVAIAAAAMLSVLFYSSFLTNPKGILDSLLAYKNYFNRAGQNQLHIHPWYYYLKMLVYSRYAAGPIWSEAFILILAALGFVVVMTRKGSPAVNYHLLTFIAFYTLIMTIFYSIIPYKTPWCLLGFLHGMILLAAVGAVAVIKLSPNVLTRTIISLILVVGAAHLACQAYLDSYKFFADPRNPYVYAHPVTDVFTISQRLESIAQAHPDGHDMYIQVICPEGDYWPLPWYLRSFTRDRYQVEPADDVPIAPVIIASPKVEPALMRILYELPPPGEKKLYVLLFKTYVELRPQVELRGYVTKDLWDSFQQHQTPIQHTPTGEK